MAKRAFKLDFVEAAKPWRKTIIVRDGKPDIARPAPFYRCTSHRVAPRSLDAAHEEILKAAKAGWALNRGLFSQPLDNEPRARKAPRSTRTDWLMFDVDGFEGTLNPRDFLQDYLGLPDVSFISVYTSSFGFKPGLRCLILIPLDKPVLPRNLDNFLWGIQLTNPEVADQIDLDVAGARLIPPIDTASNVPAQLFTIAAPAITPKKEDPFAKAPSKRYVIYHGQYETLHADVLAKYSDEEVAELKAALLVQRRTEKGFTKNPPRVTNKTDRSSGMDWSLVEDPEPATVTGVHEQGEYIRLNINGGDSDAYWHHKDRPEYIYSFKGWTMYPTRKFLPEYYEKLLAESATKAEEEGQAKARELEQTGTTVLVALDAASELYHCVVITPESTWEDVSTFTKMSSVMAWLHTHKLPKPFEDHPPVYDVLFDFDVPFFDPIKRQLNRFSPPQLPKKLPHDPEYNDLDPLIRQLVEHVLGNDTRMAGVFMDWAAFLYQRRTAPQSAWLLHGCPGTGKDTLMNLLREALGRRYTRVVMPHQLKEHYNSWVEDTSLVFINEIDASVFKGVNLVSRMNEYITAETVSVRRMRMDTYEVPNRMGIVMASNMRDAYLMPTNDRRLHVPPRQETKLIDAVDNKTLLKMVKPSEELVLKLRAWLCTRKYNEELLRRPAMTRAKEELAQAAQPAAVRLSLALQESDWAFVTELLPADHQLPDMVGFSMATEARLVLRTLYEVLGTGSRQIALNLRELQALFAVLIDPKLASYAPAKFRQYLIHNELPEVNRPRPVKRLNKSVRGVAFGLPLDKGPREELRGQLAQAGYTDTEAPVQAVK